jgi:hypothetical protein
MLCSSSVGTITRITEGAMQTPFRTVVNAEGRERLVPVITDFPPFSGVGTESVFVIIPSWGLTQVAQLLWRIEFGEKDVELSWFWLLFQSSFG